MCAAFEEHEEVPETLPLDSVDYDITWIASKLYGAAGALGAEAIELRNWILHFECVLEELRVIVFNMADWMATYGAAVWVGDGTASTMEGVKIKSADVVDG